MLANLSYEERVGLVIAGLAHIALTLVLAMQGPAMRAFVPPERMDVSLATEISLESTAPDPSLNPAAAAAPEMSDTPVPDPSAEVESPDVAAPPDSTKAPPVERDAPQRTERTVQQVRQRVRDTTQPARDQASGSRLNENFMEGLSDADGREGSPGDRPNPQQQASIDRAIISQLKPHWSPPSGVEVERLVTVVRFRLNRDGTLRGEPEVLETTGVTNGNRAQVARHREQAVRAVRLAAPFNLPERFYSGWRVVTSNFNNELAQ